MRNLLFLLSIGVLLAIPSIPADTSNSNPGQDTVIISTVPDVRQSTSYSCGASSLQAVLNYWGIDQREDELMDLLNTTPEAGTHPENITAVAASFGLKSALEENLSIDELKKSVNSKVPVIIAAQAWNGEYVNNGTWVSVTPNNWDDIWEDGHYMVVIGIDSRNVYLEDPAQLGTRGVIPIEDFINRWHDYGGCNCTGDQINVYKGLGIIISGDKPATYPAYTLVT